jgi:flagellar motor switch protein FliN/FliY
MSEISANTPGVRAWLEAWRTSTQNVLAQVSSQTIAFDISLDDLPPQAESDLLFTVVAGGSVHGEMALRVPSSSAVRLTQKFLGEVEPAAEITSDHKKAVEELFRQIAGLASTAFAPAAGGEVQLHVAASPTPSWSPALIACLRTRDEAGDPVLFELQISAALAQALQSKPAEKNATNPSADPLLSSPSPTTSSAPPPASYGRLLDVGLDVKLRFGTRRMQLRDVLALSSGIVVELESRVQSPADLLLDGRIIARGEVVVVDGKYGLRVTEIPETPPPA